MLPYNCLVEAAIDVMGGKWKPLILWWLHLRTHRFAELRRLMPGITEKMLTQQLRELEADGIVHRRVYPAESGVFAHGVRPLAQARPAGDL